MLMSKISLRDDDDRQRAKVDPIVAIYGRVREDILRNHKQTYTWEEVTSLCNGYTVSNHHLQRVACTEHDIRADCSHLVHCLGPYRSLMSSSSLIWILLVPIATSSIANAHFSVSG